MARIDDSHQPFKRTRKIGPGPKKAPPIYQTREYKCERGKPTKTHYVQLCKWVGADGKTHTATVRRKKSAKKRYNKLYRKWAAKNRTSLQRKGPLPGYRCRRTKRASCR